MKTIREKIIEQIHLQEQVQRLANINIVNCGNCGSVLLHEIVTLSTGAPAEDYDITCPYCDFTSEPCDFPDFFYSGMENSAQFDEEPKYLCNCCHESFLKEEMDFDVDDDQDLCKNCNYKSYNDAPYGDQTN